ncbi:MAG TPA: class II aldolase/adducin family protein [Solirubrobacteraceae bacterium]|jgi:L-fuculose-phosphate aldolase|nr:class II aldolase/adducin family protein [Solirubrobacteraceae bacterium]
MLERERERVAAAARRLAAEGLVLGTAGNVSARAGDLVAVTPTGAVLERLGGEEVAVVDLDGAHVDGPFAPTSELGLHLGVYRRYATGAVVHTHAPMGTALACVVDEVPVVHYAMLGLGGAIRVAPYATFGTPELAELALEALEGRAAALLSNHGTINHAADVDAAVDGALLLEWACTVYWRAAALGRPRLLDEADLTAVADAIATRGYGGLQGPAG